MKPSLFLAAFIIITQVTRFECSAQGTRDITGIVTSFKSIPLNNVRIHALKSGNTRVTDSTGRFSIKCSDKDNLIITASGFTEKKIKTGKKTIIQVNLTYVFNEESFEKAIANKHIRPDVLEKAISAEIKKNEKDYSKYNSIFQLIASEVYDVRVNGTSVYNKKIKSMDLNPLVLYVVDDKIVTDITNINPVDVKSIEFIDDVGTTMYGAKGANGVLKIYLK
jgi:ribosomal protein S3AE